MLRLFVSLFFCVGTMSTDDSDDIGFEVEDDEESNDIQSSLGDDRSETATYLSATTRHSATMSMISGMRIRKPWSPSRIWEEKKLQNNITETTC